MKVITLSILENRSDNFTEMNWDAKNSDNLPGDSGYNRRRIQPLLPEIGAAPVRDRVFHRDWMSPDS